MSKLISIFLFFLLNATIVIGAPEKGTGNVKGFIIEKSTSNPLEFANVVLKTNSDNTFVQGTITDKNGMFSFKDLNFGEYKIIYSYIGFDET